VQEMVRADKIAASTAIKILQRHGVNARRIIDAAVAEATAAGKQKVTPKHVKRVRASILGTPQRAVPMTAAMIDALRQLEQCVLAQRAGTRGAGDATIVVPVVLVDKLLTLGRDFGEPAIAMATAAEPRPREPAHERASVVEARQMVAA